MKDQVTFLVTNSGLRLVSYPRVRVVTFYCNTSPEQWTFRKVRRLNNFGHSTHARLLIKTSDGGEPCVRAGYELLEDFAQPFATRQVLNCQDSSVVPHSHLHGIFWLTSCCNLISDIANLSCWYVTGLLVDNLLVVKWIKGTDKWLAFSYLKRFVVTYLRHIF